jgi:hypothetical protein
VCFFSPVSSTNKTDRYDIAEKLLKVALNTIKQTNLYWIDFYGENKNNKKNR